MDAEDRSIDELAYRLWQARGCPEGTAEQDWLEAERQLAGQSRLPATEVPAPVAITPPSGERAPRPRALRSKPASVNPSSDRPS
jgi:Protein of unknown function (DUF2934)